MRFLVAVGQRDPLAGKRTVAVHAETAEEARKQVEANVLTPAEHVVRVTLIAR